VVLPAFETGSSVVRALSGRRFDMAAKSKAKKKSDHSETKTQRVAVHPDDLVKLVSMITGTIVALGILIILAIIICGGTPEMQERALPLLTGMLGVIVGRMLTPQGPTPPKPSETPTPQG